MMKRLLFLLTIFFSISVVKASDYVETYNQVSDNYINSVHNAGVIRQINGGTVIIPEFDETCPNDIKGPFMYACKIVEEYLYPCLPLRIKVSCGNLTGSASSSISKIKYLTRENFEYNVNCKNSPMSMIKGVIVAELSRNETRTYLDSIPNVNFLTREPDIEITYNNSKLDEMSFSFEPVSEDRFDFISVAMRDILIGLGFTSGYRINPITGGLDYPVKQLIPFEDNIKLKLESYDNPVERLNKATQGGLIIGGKNTYLTLYAPNPWKNGTSLNYFIPQDDCLLSQILSYDFCKGMAFRSISDGYDRFIFEDILYWRANYTTGDGTGTSYSGNTSLFMPYNGSLTIESPQNITVNSNNKASYSNPPIRESQYNSEVMEYANSFHPFIFSEESGFTGNDGLSICLLKKDGFWDLVYFNPYPDFDSSGMTLNMSEWTLNYNDDEYARTMDGYLRARVTLRYQNRFVYDYKTTFVVVDYLPQKVGLTYKLNSQSLTKTNANSLDESNNAVRLYFSDIEGLDRIVLERLREGSRVPSRIIVTDFRKGYYDTTIDKTTTFTAVGYNNNGTSRSTPVRIELLTPASDVTFKLEDNKISIDNIAETSEYKYDIIPLNITTPTLTKYSVFDKTIDISNLSKGIYVLNLYDNSNCKLGEFKFSR